MSTHANAYLLLEPPPSDLNADADLPIRRWQEPEFFHLCIPGKGWVAEIMGSDPDYRYARVFLSGVGARGGKEYRLRVGRVYDVCTGDGDRYYARVVTWGGVARIERLSPATMAWLFPQPGQHDEKGHIPEFPQPLQKPLQ